jgi:hypothetical protein
LESRIDILISDLVLFCLLGTHKEFEDEKKKNLEVTRMVVSLLLMLQWATINYPIASACAIPEGTNTAGLGK